MAFSKVASECSIASGIIIGMLEMVTWWLACWFAERAMPHHVHFIRTFCLRELAIDASCCKWACAPRCAGCIVCVDRPQGAAV